MTAKQTTNYRTNQVRTDGGMFGTAPTNRLLFNALQTIVLLVSKEGNDYVVTLQIFERGWQWRQSSRESIVMRTANSNNTRECSMHAKNTPEIKHRRIQNGQRCWQWWHSSFDCITINSPTNTGNGDESWQ
jgi:hypothetical protein